MAKYRVVGVNFVYRKDAGGGSLLDYLGYGTTLGTWFLDGAKPLEVTAVADEPENLQVDEHSVTIARYAFGLSKFETRWAPSRIPGRTSLNLNAALCWSVRRARSAATIMKRPCGCRPPTARRGSNCP